MKPEDLWNLGTVEFNRYRRENDLPVLFRAFKKTLPNFEEWLSVHSLTEETILETDQPGAFFYGKFKTMFLKNKANDQIEYSFFEIEDKAHENRLLEINKNGEDEVLFFTPYLIWAKKKLNQQKIIPGLSINQFESFHIQTANASEVPELSTVVMAPGIKLLKLGGTKIEGWALTTNLNLDFADLDHLIIEGDAEWNREKKIYYSSCRNIKFINANVSFTSFYGCWFEKSSVNDSKFYQVDFNECDLFSCNFNSSKLTNVTFNNSCLSRPQFHNIEVENLNYLPPQKEWYNTVAMTYENTMLNYKILRVLFQNGGHRSDAGRAYYNERVFEMKSSFASINWSEVTFNRKYWYRGKYKLMENINHFLNYILLFISWCLWGFGEKPIRTIYFSAAIMLLYSLVYYFSSVPTLEENSVNSIYLSTIMFSTLGFGDYTHLEAGGFKLVPASESLLGAFTVGLFVAGYANKSKY